MLLPETPFQHLEVILIQSHADHTISSRPSLTVRHPTPPLPRKTASIFSSHQLRRSDLPRPCRRLPEECTFLTTHHSRHSCCPPSGPGRYLSRCLCLFPEVKSCVVHDVPRPLCALRHPAAHPALSELHPVSPFPPTAVHSRAWGLDRWTQP